MMSVPVNFTVPAAKRNYPVCRFIRDHDMRYNMQIPCSNCPFLKEGGIRLVKSRARDIAKGMLDSQGITFPCHKTTTDEEREEEDDGHFIPRDHHIHCAGALIFAEKNGNATQMMRIAERLGIYDAKKLMSNKEVVASVFDSLAQMVKVQLKR